MRCIRFMEQKRKRSYARGLVFRSFMILGFMRMENGNQTGGLLEGSGGLRE